MRNLCFLLVVLVVLVVSCGGTKTPAQPEVYMFTSFHEPAIEGLRFLYSYDGYKWDSVPGVFLAPEIGSQKIMRDPSIVASPDGTFHLVWTCSWRGDRGFGYASSTDLKNWSPSRHIPIMESDTSTVNVWAPELFYDDVDSNFVVVWASTVPYKFDKGAEDEKNNHRLYYTKTKDFQQFSQPKLLYDPGYSSIDAQIVKRAKNDYVLVYKDNTRPERNMLCAFAEKAEGPYQNPTQKFTQNLTEGPSTIKVGEQWLIYFDSYGSKKYGAVSTKDFIDYTDISDKISIPQGHKHGTIFKVKESILKGLIDE